MISSVNPGRTLVRAGAALGISMLASMLVGCSSGEDEPQFTIFEPPPAAEACPFQAEPTPELEAAGESLREAGYRTRYGGYSELGFFVDESETEEFCADSVLGVEGKGLRESDRFLIRQYDEPERFAQGAAALVGSTGGSAIERPPLLYFYGGGDPARVERVLTAAGG